MELEHICREDRPAVDGSVVEDRGSTSGVPRPPDPFHVEAHPDSRAGSADIADQRPRPKRSLCENAHKLNR